MGTLILLVPHTLFVTPLPKGRACTGEFISLNSGEPLTTLKWKWSYVISLCLCLLSLSPSPSPCLSLSLSLSFLLKNAKCNNIIYMCVNWRQRFCWLQGARTTFSYKILVLDYKEEPGALSGCVEKNKKTKTVTQVKYMVVKQSHWWGGYSSKLPIMA